MRTAIALKFTVTMSAAERWMQAFFPCRRMCLLAGETAAETERTSSKREQPMQNLCSTKWDIESGGYALPLGAVAFGDDERPTRERRASAAIN